jgi:hypothetical protein
MAFNEIWYSGVFQFWLKLDNSNRHFTWRHIYFCAQQRLGGASPRGETIAGEFQASHAVMWGILHDDTITQPGRHQSPRPHIGHWVPNVWCHWCHLETSKVKFWWMCQNCYAVRAFHNLFYFLNLALPDIKKESLNLSNIFSWLRICFINSRYDLNMSMLVFWVVTLCGLPGR